MDPLEVLELDLDELDLDEIFAGDLVEEAASSDPASILGFDPELTQLSRRISGQYVEVIATWARSAFRSHHPVSTRQPLDAALPALRRLAEATSDTKLSTALAELDALVCLDDGSRRGRQRLVPRLRDWLRDLAVLLEGGDARRLRDLVEFDRQAFPLLEELAAVHGIGPRRLERLYLAGLFTVEALFEADPDDVALVTGLPRGLSEEVVQAAARFERRWRHQVAEELRRRTDEVRAVLAWIESSGRQDEDVMDAVQASIEELRQALAAARHDTGEQT